MIFLIPVVIFVIGLYCCQMANDAIQSGCGHLTEVQTRNTISEVLGAGVGYSLIANICIHSAIIMAFVMALTKFTHF